MSRGEKERARLYNGWGVAEDGLLVTYLFI